MIKRTINTIQYQYNSVSILYRPAFNFQDLFILDQILLSKMIFKVLFETIGDKFTLWDWFKQLQINFTLRENGERKRIRKKFLQADI